MAGEFMENYNNEMSLNAKLNSYFAGRVVRKDLTKKIKEGANVSYMFLNTFGNGVPRTKTV